MSVARQATRRQDGAECFHNKRAFDMGFADVVHRQDLTPVARVLHPYLVTLTRTEYAAGRYPTQLQIAKAVGLTRHQVWAGLRELVRAGLIVSIRPGLGHPNYYQLIGEEDPSAEHPSGPETAARPGRAPESGQAGNLVRAGTYDQKKKRNLRKGGDYDTKDYRETRGPSGTDYTQTRYGPLRQREQCSLCYSHLHEAGEHGETTRLR